MVYIILFAVVIVLLFILQKIFVSKNDAAIPPQSIPPTTNLLVEEIPRVPLVYNEDEISGLKVDPLFIETATVIVQGQKCSYGYLYQTMGLYPNRVDELVKELIKYRIISPRTKKQTQWKVLIVNEIQLEELLNNIK